MTPAFENKTIEALVTYDPFMYLCEMQAALQDDLKLPPAEVPSLLTICRTLLSLDLTCHKGSKVPLERFTPENKGFCELATNCRSEEAVFC